MATGTPVVIGFYPSSQSHLDERYMNNGVPYASTAEVLSTLPLISRALYLPVNVSGVDYWFYPDLLTLAPVVGTLSLVDGSVTLVKMANLPAGTVIANLTAGSAVPTAVTLAALATALGVQGYIDTSLFVLKAAGYSLISAVDLTSLHNQSGTNTGDETNATILAKLGITIISGENTGDQDLSLYVLKVTGKDLSTNDYTTIEKNKLAIIYPIIRITMPAASSIAGRLAGMVAGTDYPLGWTLTASGSTDLLITHTLTGLKIATVTVYEIDTPGDRLLAPFSTAYTGVLGNTGTVLIEGLAPSLLALRMELTFN